MIMFTYIPIQSPSGQAQHRTPGQLVASVRRANVRQNVRQSPLHARPLAAGASAAPRPPVPVRSMQPTVGGQTQTPAAHRVARTQPECTIPAAAVAGAAATRPIVRGARLRSQIRAAQFARRALSENASGRCVAAACDDDGRSAAWR